MERERRGMIRVADDDELIENGWTKRDLCKDESTERKRPQSLLGIALKTKNTSKHVKSQKQEI
jgi:hypothetical protein